MIQEYLNHQFIKIGEDENLEKLQKASDEIAKKISKNKAVIISYTLIALDPNISPENADVVEVKNTIIKNWKTFVENSQDTPMTFIRAVILDALKEISKDDLQIAALIWLSSRNVIRFFNLGREQDIILNFLLELGNRIEEDAVNNWTYRGTETTGSTSKDVPAATVDKATLQKLFEYASGPTNSKNEIPYQDPNPHWPNSGQAWSFEFASRAATAVTNIVTKSLKDQVKEINAGLQSMKNHIIEEIQKGKVQNIKTELLWWKEAAYSQSLRQGFRELENGMLQFAFANDFSKLIPIIYPSSVDYFYREVYKSVTSNSKDKVTFSALLTMIEKHAEPLKSIVTIPKEGQTRISLATFLKKLVTGQETPAQFQNLVGVDLTTEISFSDFSLWLFHDFHASKITMIK